MMNWIRILFHERRLMGRQGLRRVGHVPPRLRWEPTQVSSVGFLTSYLQPGKTLVKLHDQAITSEAAAIGTLMRTRIADHRSTDVRCRS